MNHSMDFRKGDLIKSSLAGVKGKHICIILNDIPFNGHIQCLPVCNFTGTQVANENEFAIDISQYDLPDSWFKYKKPTSWIRCNNIDCIHAVDIDEDSNIGNIKDSFPDLWNKICEETAKCTIAPRLSELCDCKYEEIQKGIDNGLIEEPDCNCAT